MNVVRELLCLIIVTSFSVFLLCCEEEAHDTEVPLRVISTGVQEGGTIPGNASIYMTFSNEMKWVEMRVSGATGITTVDGRTAIWTPMMDIPPGSHELTATGMDMFDQELAGFEPIVFTASGGWIVPPELVFDKCDPKHGAVDVDPEEYPEKLLAAFSEPLMKANVISTKPEFPFAAELTGDANILEIRFLDYTMPGGVRFTIKLKATDLAGNEAELEYSFTTIAKEGE